ncbi:FAD-binding oxidoreductase [Chitinasiproducens palmae]|uniref:FAD/FMN-containing dehydrogenase n=1 Tax=Chitinasiproducens palmae TaxID=1770053 RepID=A0A1H2PV77_9BURK|nr:FAD-binding oxidoreductase [Chitinasiproducens palmae]SDV50737.1 FAD/FMN-containing dehydrogenase [Chitinasiproducens palmae]
MSVSPRAAPGAATHGTKATADGWRAAMRGILAPADLIEDQDAATPFCVDWFGRYAGRARAVALPRNTDQVASVVKACADHQVPIVPQGGNTGVCGGAVPSAGGDALLLNLSRMNRVREIDAVSDVIVVEAGCILADVQQAAAAAGRLFPLSLSTEGSCQIGGNLSTNAGGTAVARYGTARELTLGVEVVLPDGRIWDGLRRTRKDSSGYDLATAFVGAEGTLGIVTAASLRLFPPIRESALAWVGFDHPQQALALLAALRDRFGTRVSAFELLSRSLVTLIGRHLPDAPAPLKPAPAWAALVELGDTWHSGGLMDALETALADAADHGLLSDAVLAQTGAQADALWRIRHAATDAMKGAGVTLTHDVAVPLSRVPVCIERTGAMLAERYPTAVATVVSHLGDGNIHHNVTFSPGDWAAMPDAGAARDAISDAVLEIAVELGGTFVAEHGIGQRYLHAAARFKSPLAQELARRLKSAFDPHGLLNPGRLIVPE